MSYEMSEISSIVPYIILYTVQCTSIWVVCQDLKKTPQQQQQLVLVIIEFCNIPFFVYHRLTKKGGIYKNQPSLVLRISRNVRLGPSGSCGSAPRSCSTYQLHPFIFLVQIRKWWLPAPQFSNQHHWRLLLPT